jgi:hypothetical protein
MCNRPLLLFIAGGLAALSLCISDIGRAHGGGGHSGGGSTGGGSGGSHGGGGGHSSGSHGGSFRGNGGFHNGAFRGGGYQPGGWRRPGGYYGHGWNRGGWGALGYGLYFSALPWYCDLYYWDGVPYYYSDDTYYEWNGSVGAYETVAPPAGLADQVAAQEPVVTELFVYPKGSQTNEQIDRDRSECHQWAAGQAGLDPTQAKDKNVGSAASKDPSKTGKLTAAKRTEYLRADGACLEGRNYSVE